jgi:hypothetical protein
MSAILDFRELRDKVLAGEGDEELEPVETPMSSELKSKGTLIGLSAAAAIFGGLVFDKVTNKDMPMFTGAWIPGLMAVGGVALGYAVGGLNRGMEAQTEKDRYERLLDDSQSVIEEQQEEMESMETENEEKEAEQQAEAENDYQYDYLSAEDSFFHGPSLGMGVGAFGQEGVLYRPNQSSLPW